MIEELLLRAGVPAYKTNLITTITTSKEINLGQQAPENIGWIYGISLNVGGTDYQGNTLISLADSYNLWLNLKIQTNVFTQSIRLANFIYLNPSAIRTTERNYMPVSIPLQLDWKQSSILNPTGIASGIVNFDFYYIDIPSYNKLVANQMILKPGN